MNALAFVPDFLNQWPASERVDGGLSSVQCIGDLVREKKLEGISDLRDESDKSGMRVVIELKRGEIAEDKRILTLKLRDKTLQSHR